ncbi:hypothetical protein L6270_03310 [Candidatus Parcubacteria bacterium]|nr:hypothetical protein [Patescibacteria group bacterium]MBU4308993.1 hypothetical protein [Patescibacteria group bacterium]MBU4432216.1 hypothetical protein [Patescibacteria group bacterium]MBU4577353.1 hypothetical protein [Patescibacteria group bacterium]MCG2697041.1 hypothetical protein [Candidatus Parcubacteria bacterium]
MSKLQEVFDRIQKTKKEQKELKSMFRDSLVNSKSYQEAVEDLKVLRDKKKKIEDAIKEDFNSELAKLDILKSDIDNDYMLLSDAALTKIMKGEMIEVVDEKDNKYEPIFSVKFKKS